MIAVTVMQPFASLIAAGLKRYETRSWHTPHRGRIAIHAGKKVLPHDVPADVLRELGVLPHSAVICTADLVRCVRTEEIAAELDYLELAAGDYTPGRWAWELADIRVLARPQYTRGWQRLWQWHVTASKSCAPSAPATSAATAKTSAAIRASNATHSRLF